MIGADAAPCAVPRTGKGEVRLACARMGIFRVNGRTVVTQKSAGLSFASGDVCKLPQAAGTVPFSNLALSLDAADCATTVRNDGVEVAHAGSIFARSCGDELGIDGGVISHTTQGPARFSNYSFDVRIQGKPVPRALDPMIHNLDGAGIPNAASPAELQSTGQKTDKDMLCEAVCACNFQGGKTACVRQTLATPVYRRGVRCWDPRAAIPGYPAVYVEVPFQMGPPPSPVMTTVPSQTRKDAAGNPLPLPWGDLPPIHGTRRPDIVVVKDPTKPPTPDNIKDIYEVKFPPDDWGEDQEDDYKRITGRRPILLSPEECQCEAKKLPKYAPVPVPQQGPSEEPKKEQPPEPRPIPIEPPVPAPMELPSVEPAVKGILAVLLGILLGGLRPKPIPGPSPMPVPAPAGVPVFPWDEPGQTT